MRVVRSLLVAVLLVGLMPAAAQAHETRVKTKMVFVDRDEWGYVRFWSLDTTSVTPIFAKARLLYYKPSIKKWVGYAGRTVTVTRSHYGPDYQRHSTSWKKVMDSKGYFTVKMSEPEDYTLKYGGSRDSLACSKSESRVDEVQVRRSSTFATSSVDASHTRITVATDYQYNPYVAEKTGHVGLNTGYAVSDNEYRDVKWIYRGFNELLERPFTGYGHSEFSVVVPSYDLYYPFPFFMLTVGYEGPYNFSTEDYDDTDPWFY